MATIAVDALASSVALAREPAELPARPPISLSGVRVWWARATFWPAELLRLVALIYMLPIVFYAIGVPIALAVNALYFLVTGSWKGFWH